jgi:DNA-binding transcriptional regulator GbsR (MarR family)
MGRVHRLAKPGDRKDYYKAETDFYGAIRSILAERQNPGFGSAIRSVRETLTKLDASKSIADDAERQFIIE